MGGRPTLQTVSPLNQKLLTKTTLFLKYMQIPILYTDLRQFSHAGAPGTISLAALRFYKGRPNNRPSVHSLGTYT
jgi:hypothetical protein